jgi:hypothetical protein
VQIARNPPLSDWCSRRSDTRCNHAFSPLIDGTPWAIIYAMRKTPQNVVLASRLLIANVEQLMQGPLSCPRTPPKILEVYACEYIRTANNAEIMLTILSRNHVFSSQIAQVVSGSLVSGL